MLLQFSNQIMFFCSFVMSCKVLEFIIKREVVKLEEYLYGLSFVVVTSVNSCFQEL